jgi:Omp85 superfamily domain
MKSLGGVNNATGVTLKGTIRTFFGRSGELLHFGVAMVLALAWFGTQPASSAAQTSRAQVIEDEQKAKSANLGIEGPSAGEKVVERIRRSPLLVGSGGVYPWFGSVYPGTGFGIGAGYLRHMPYGSRLNLHAAISLRGSSILNIQARLPEIGRGLIAVTLDASRTEAKKLLFYGRGPDSTAGSAIHYDLVLAEAGATATVSPVHWFQLFGGYKWLNVDGLAQLPVPPSVLPGRGQELRYQVGHAGAAIDWRTSPGYCTHGGLYRVIWSDYQETQNRPFSFQSVECEAVQLMPFVREQFVLAVRGLVTMTMTAEGNEVPFMLAPTLGSDDTLRGFVTRRFTDRNRVLLTAEYRWRPSRFVDMAVFVDAGKVAPRRSDLDLASLETDWGIGIRIHGRGFTALRMEVAKSREGWRAVLAEHQVF